MMTAAKKVGAVLLLCLGLFGSYMLGAQLKKAMEPGSSAADLAAQVEALKEKVNALEQVEANKPETRAEQAQPVQPQDIEPQRARSTATSQPAPTAAAKSPKKEGPPARAVPKKSATLEKPKPPLFDNQQTIVETPASAPDQSQGTLPDPGTLRLPDPGKVTLPEAGWTNLPE